MGDLFTKPQAKSGSIRRGLSPTLFHQAPIVQFMSGDLGEGFGFIDDFLVFDDASYRWLLTQDGSAGTAALDTAAKGGVLLIDSASSSAGLGPDLQMGGAAAACSYIPSAASSIYFETRFKVADIGSTTVQAFVGLSAITAPLIDSNANASANHIGFETFDSLTLTFATEKATNRTADTSAGTIAEGTYVKVGFVVDGLSSVTPYVNGVARPKITTNIPIVDLTPSLCVRSAGTTDPILHVDWVACFQAEQISN